MFGCGSVRGGEGRCEERCRGAGKVCWGEREGEGRCGIGVEKCVEMWRKMRKSVWGERGKVCWGVGEKWGKYGGVGESKERCGGC